MSLSGKFARHLETKAIVEIVKTGVATSDKLCPVPVIEFSCECGSSHALTVDEFFTAFEIVEPVDVRVMEIEAPMDDHQFWADIMDVLEAHCAEDAPDEDEDQWMAEVLIH